MQKILQPLIDWLGGNWGWVILVFCTLFEIAPIKIHPVTAFLSWIGKKLTGDIRKDLNDLRSDFDQQRIALIRETVLDFANSCINSRKHTKEEFEYIINENKTYELLVQKYKINNDVYKESYDYILRLYRRLLDDGKFMPVPAKGQEICDD